MLFSLSLLLLPGVQDGLNNGFLVETCMLKLAIPRVADFIGGEDMVAKVQGGWMDYDAVVATPDMMKSVGRLGKVLGPRGLMPNPKTGTVTFEVSRAIKEIKAGKVEFRTDKTGIIHAPVGKLSFESQKLVDNAVALITAVLKAKPATAKGKYVRSVTLASTMGPGVPIDPSRIRITDEDLVATA